MKLGSYAENCAINYLKNKGYVILEKNYRYRKNEIDIICEKNGVVVFVEVKARQDDNFGYPLESIDYKKVEKIIKVANYYLCSRGLLGECNTRFDIISIYKNKIDHIEDAFK